MVLLLEPEVSERPPEEIRKLTRMLSYPENIPAILKASTGYKKVLDVGPGFGKYGLLLREHYLSNKASCGELIPTDDYQIDCLELTPYFYNKDLIDYIYNNVHIGSVFDKSMDFFEQYDLVLLIDVVEHYEKKFVQDWLNNLPTRALISTPKVTHMYTEHYFGDPHHHKSQWDLFDFNLREDFSTNLSHIVIV